MINLNKIIVCGNLTADPEKKVTESGTTITTFSIATNRHYTKDGQKQQETEYHDIVFFGKQAENIVKYLSKGSQALVEGRLQTRSWEGKDGKKNYRTEIVGQNVQFGSRKESKDNEYAGSDDDINLDDIPF